MRWWNNGQKNVRAKDCPEGFKPGMLANEEIENKKSACQHRKSVQQISKDGNILRVFVSLSNAAKELGIQKNQIINCCKGKSKTAGGFIWKYA